jgi:hypothetical protein
MAEPLMKLMYHRQALDNGHHQKEPQHPTFRAKFGHLLVIFSVGVHVESLVLAEKL